MFDNLFNNEKYSIYLQIATKLFQFLMIKFVQRMNYLCDGGHNKVQNIIYCAKRKLETYLP